jgi:hypothetical protein
VVAEPMIKNIELPLVQLAVEHQGAGKKHLSSRGWALVVGAQDTGGESALLVLALYIQLSCRG